MTVSPRGPGELRATRRGFAGWMGKIGLVAISGAAGLAAAARRADADIRPQANWGCCSLKYSPPNCPTDQFGNFFCADGNMNVWYCCTGSVKYACGECNSGTDCEHALNFYCSAAWTVRRNGC